MLTRTSQDALRDLNTTLRGLLPRQRHDLAPLLRLTLDVARHGSDSQVAQLLNLGPLVKHLWDQAEDETKQDCPQSPPLQWPEGEAPWELAESLVTELLARTGRPGAVVPASAGSRRLGARLRSEWLMAAATRWEHSQAQPSANEPPPGTQDRACMKLLLWDPYEGQGQVARLTLYLVRQPGARLALAAAPASAFTPCTRSFSAALQAATNCWRQYVKPGSDVHDTALAWDIDVPGSPLWSLDGPSAGAALALCGLWLLRRHLDENRALRLEMMRIYSAKVLADVHVTAELLSHDVLGEVGHVEEKARALNAHMALTQSPTLVYAVPGEAKSLRQQVDGATVLPVDSLLALAESVAARENVLTGHQQQLLQLLLDHPLESPQPPEVGQDILEVVAGRTQHPNPVKTLVQYALNRWAWWALASRGQVHNRFVPLRIVPDSSQLPDDLRVSATPAKGLQDLLAGCQHSSLVAFMLRGSPGAGKSTLLQAHEQALCHQALQRWCQDGTWSELPLYVPLSGLGAEVDPVVWLNGAVRDEYPDCQPLHDLLRAHRRADDPPLQLMCDGLNELQHSDRESRNERALHVLQALWKALKPPLSMLLSARTHHVFDLRELGYVAPVDVLPWSDDELRAYINRRFPPAQQPGVAEGHWASLCEQKHVLDFWRNPFNLNGQCDLWAAGSKRLASHRADLYKRLLWQAVVRQLKVEQHVKDSPLRAHQDLLSTADRDALLMSKVMDQNTLPPWPRQGALLDSLFRQGRAQWLRADETHPGVPATARGEVEVPWDHPTDPGRSVAHWLRDKPNGLREKWRRTVRELSLLDDFQPRRHQGDPDGARSEKGFKWRHQSWGEYLASVDLLTPTPQDMPEDQLADLLRRLQAGRGFERSALDELDHQEQQVSKRWSLPERPGFWQELLDADLTVSRSEVQRFLREEWGWVEQDLQVKPSSQFSEVGRWQQCVQFGVLIDEPANDRCRPDLKRWGRVAGRALGVAVDKWHQHPAAWQRLVVVELWPPFARMVWERLGDSLARELKEQPGTLSLRSRGDLDEVLGLALLGLEDPLPWLRWLLQQGLWCALGPCLADLARRLEPAGPWPTESGQKPNPVLQHLRRALLLTSLDAGADVRQRVQASGMLELLAMDVATWGTDPALAGTWQAHWASAFSTPTGQDLRVRLEAAAMLGSLGDNLRYERALVGGQWHPGLRLKPALWAGLGQPGQRSAYGIGSGPHDRHALVKEGSAFEQPYRYFELARLAVTVAEWQRFVDAGGYDKGAPWWSAQAVGQAAHDWMEGQGRGRRPFDWGHPDLNNPLQPVVGITAYEAQAYVAWAAPLYAPAKPDGLELALPCEVMWEAGMRGPHGMQPFAADQQPLWLYPVPGSKPGPLDFNHANTRWGRSSPVGVFSTSFTAHGVADAHGNTWDWCCNISHGAWYDKLRTAQARDDWRGGDAVSPRAQRGGSCYSTATSCRVAYRNQRHPGVGNSDVGLRLVRCVLPHSEH